MSATPLPNLVGRHRECAQLEDLLARVRSGNAGVCALRGEPGIGKSALLDYLAGQASELVVTRTQGVEADMELAYGGLHQVCVPFLGGIDRLPAPQRHALQVAFGLAAGEPPDRFLVGLAVLNLLTAASETRPVLLIVDDAHWLDQVSLQTLEFVARRLLAEPVGVVFGIRDPDGAGALLGIPEIRVAGLDAAAAGVLLDTVVDGPLEGPIRERLVAETGGHPPGPLEGPRGTSVGELAYGLLPEGPGSVWSRIEQDFIDRVGALP